MIAGGSVRWALLFATLTAFAMRRLLRYLRFFQQEEYSARRYFTWIVKAGAFDRRGTLASLVAAAAAAIWAKRTGVIVGGFASALVLLSLSEPNPFRSGKLPLRMTARASRIFVASAVPVVATGYALSRFIVRAGLSSEGSLEGAAMPWLLMALMIQLLPATLVFGNAVLAPEELVRQRRYSREAQNLLDRYRPFVVAVTGSYGKTSTKLMLAEMLSQAAPTFCPPGSTNTVMGISRHVRESLRPDHRFAVLEYGAYKRGSIARLCALAPPSASIITSIGIMHLERFGSEEAVVLAKSELAAATPPGHLLILNGDDGNCRRVGQKFADRKVIWYGISSVIDLDYRLEVLSSEAGCTDFRIHCRDAEHRGRVPIMGLHLLRNMLGAFAMSIELGVAPNLLLAVIRNMRTHSNRLEITSDAGITVLRDAYNSNPVGFQEALSVLGTFGTGRKILLTPGMVELGPRQFEENATVAERAVTLCDHVIFVGSTNRQALLKGANAAADRKAVVETVQTREEGLARIHAVSKAGDTVLIENDLPDLYDECKGL
jgi:UDP-N-acetylmuramoyl-tripeptide--D-alanyl-D-alanine ligase